MEIGKQVFRSIQRVLQQRLVRMTINKTWLQIHNEFAIGSRVGKYLALSPDDREQLRSTLLQTTGLDPLHDDIESDRLAMSRRGTNEKLASQLTLHSY